MIKRKNPMLIRACSRKDHEMKETGRKTDSQMLLPQKQEDMQRNKNMAWKYGCLIIGTTLAVMSAVHTNTQSPILEKTEPVQVQISKLDETENEAYRIPPEWVFGKTEDEVPGRLIQISGLSASEKSKLNFQESAFLTALSSFFKKQEIEVSSVRFIEKLSGSSEAAWSYLAELGEKSERQLVVTLFPKLPNSYLFALQNKQQEETETESKGNMQNETSSILYETEAQHQETEKPEAGQTQLSYDASSFSIKHLSSELKNYIGNEYLLQYELYHYLYGRENQMVTDASVSGYQIDPDTRRAEVIFSISNGSVVNGTFWLDSGSWEFSSQG